MNQRDWRKWAIIAFKYCPVITAGVMLIHMIFIMFGVTLGIAESFCGLSLFPLIVAYCLSKGLGFCKMHRMFIDYTAKIFICMQWHQWIGFGQLLLYVQWLMLLLGIGIFIYFGIHFNEFKVCKGLQIDKAPMEKIH